MASRNRVAARSTPHRRSVAPTPARRSTVPADELTDELPPYKKPCRPLNRDAQDQLRVINGRSTIFLKDHNEKAAKLITEAAGLINDKLREREEEMAKRRKRWERGVGTEDQETEEQSYRKLQEGVDEATKQLEASMRAVIDEGAAAQRIEDSLDWLRQNAPGHLEREYATQMTQYQSQRQSQLQRSRPTQGSDDDDNSREDEVEGATPGPTPLDGSRPVLTGASELFADRMARKKSEYTSISFTGRYAKHNAYIGFKKMVHDAKYQDDRPLPHPDTWFTESGSPAPGITNAGGASDDDDIVMDRATISTRCPITFQRFKEPYTSVKCPHTFEKTAILEMIRRSNTRVGGGQRGAEQRAVECPVAGCSQVCLTLGYALEFRALPKDKRGVC